MGNAGCPRCGSAVSLHESRPFVTASGAVELWHRTCFDIRDQPLPVVEELQPVRYAQPQTVIPSRARLVGAIAGTLVLGGVLVGWATAGTTAADVAKLDVSVQEATAIRGASAAHEIVPPRVV